MTPSIVGRNLVRELCNALDSDQHYLDVIAGDDGGGTQ